MYSRIIICQPRLLPTIPNEYNLQLLYTTTINLVTKSQLQRASRHNVVVINCSESSNKQPACMHAWQYCDSENKIYIFKQTVHAN